MVHCAIPPVLPVSPASTPNDISHSGKVKMYRERRAESGIGWPRGGHPARSGLWSFDLVLFVVEPGEPAGQPVHGDFEAGVEVHEGTQPLREPGHADLFVAAPVFEFLDAAVGEVHRSPQVQAEGIAVSRISRWLVACLAADP